MFFFNWNDPNKNVQDDATDSAQAAQDPAVQPTPQTNFQSDTQVNEQPFQQLPQAPQPPTDYVDAYTPPVVSHAADSGDVQPHLKHTPWSDDQDVREVQYNQDTQADQDLQKMQAIVDQELSQAAEPVQSEFTQSEESRPQESQPVESDAENDQSLEAQNIFDLLGAADGEETEKEAFLDELQQVVWEDFVQTDAQTLLTESEFAEFSKIVNQPDVANEEMQEKALEYLEKLVPDLEDILLEKALQLKEDLVWERVMGMKEYFAGQDQQLQAVIQAEALFKQARWQDGAQLLNTLS